MPMAAEHLDYIAAHLASAPALARYASRLSLSGVGDEVVVGFGERSLSIRVSGQGLVVGNDEVSLGENNRETLGRVAGRLALRLSQMDG